jgi:hypothetical protein
MATTLVFNLTLLFNQEVPDAAGNWQYAAADAVEAMTGRKAQLIAAKRANSYGGVSFPVSILTATMFLPAENGAVPANLTLQGVHDLTTNNETGSVSSASSEFAAYIGGPFAFDASAGVLIISPRCC